MANKQYFGAEARAKLKAGIDAVFNSVAPTLGANGRNTVYNKWTRIPIITNDGVSIAREVEPEDLAELQGANLLKQVSERTNDEAGDGTTTSIVLAHSMIETGMNLLNTDPTVNPMQLRREMKEATEKVVAALKASALPVTSLESLEQVATISVEDPELGKKIAKAIFDAGDNGIVYVNESQVVGVTVEKIEGFQVPQGMVTPLLLTDIDKMETELNNPAILVTDLPLMFNKEFLTLIESITKKTKHILIVCDEIHPDVIKFAAMNTIKKNFTLSIIKKPMAKEYLEDIAAICGATAMVKDKGMIHPKVEYLGTCGKVIINEKTTKMFISDTDKIKEYVETLQNQLKEFKDDEIQTSKLQERIARLTGGVYLLNVGDKTEAESKYLKLKVDDAVNAVKAAREEGIVAGGGMALFNLSRQLEEDLNNGSTIIYKACICPLATIIKNSGMEFSSIVSQVDNSSKGFDALKLEVIPDMILAGIIDPVKVTRCAFENASSFAGLLLTTETLITPIAPPEPSRLNQ